MGPFNLGCIQKASREDKSDAFRRPGAEITSVRHWMETSTDKGLFKDGPPVYEAIPFGRTNSDGQWGMRDPNY